MLDLKALPVLRKNMDAFIRADPLDIVLVRTEKKRTVSGGYVQVAPTPLPPQQFRLVPFKRRLSNFVARTDDGEIPGEDWVLVGRINVDIQRDDTFTYNGDEYRIISIEPKTDDRSKTDRVVAEVQMLGGDKNPPD